MSTANFLKEINSLLPLFKPESIAIIGASSNPAKPSGQPLVSLTRCGFKGRVYPVNPNYHTLLNLPCYPSLKDIPDQVDLCIIAVPARMTMSALEECAAKDVRGVIIFTSGFAEVGSGGAAIQRQMTTLARETGMRICGPNCMGIFSAQNALMANFAVTDLPDKVLVPDYLGFISQSGGFGVAIYELIKEKGYGFSHFVSTGNEADLEFSHYLGYMATDDHTRVIGGYLEGVKDGQKFLQAADMALANSKPIMLMKAGRYPAAARAAASHTGALVGSEKVYNAVFRQKGIIRVESLEEFQTMLSVMHNNKIPRGKRTAILATSGGSGVMLADKCAHYGLEVVPLQDKTRSALAALLPDFASTANPVDITSAIMTQPGLLEQCAQIVISDPNVDMMIVAYWTEFGDRSNLDQMIRVGRRTDKPVFNLSWGPEKAVQDALQYMNSQLTPAAREVDFIIKGLATLANYHHFVQSRKKSKSAGPIIPEESKNKAAAILDNLSPGAKLSEYTAKQVLRAYGIPTTTEQLVTTAEEAVTAAGAIGYPVVMKIESPDILHKTDAGGVLLDINTPIEVRSSFRKLMDNAGNYNPSADIKGVLVQQMLPCGTEMIVGIGNDNIFGSTVLVGLGGIFVEALEDIALRVVPVSSLDAVEMLSELKGRRVLDGLRGQPPADKKALVEIIQRTACLAQDFPGIAELDINPLIVFPEGQGACAADALIVMK
ncbi:acetate--CoA ligase family protein [Desulfoscipio gibsoniae]